MNTTRVARRYAAALMSSAASAGDLETLGRDLDAIGKTLDGSRELRLLLASPVVRPDKKGDVIRALFGKTIGAGTQGFLDMLLEKRREPHLRRIVAEFRAMRDERQGIVNVHVTAASTLSSEQERSLHNELGRMTGKDVRLTSSVDAGLKGGLVVQLGDTVLDASLKRQLELLRERLLTGDALTHSRDEA